MTEECEHCDAQIEGEYECPDCGLALCYACVSHGVVCERVPS